MKLFFLHITAVILLAGQEQLSISGKVLSMEDGTAIAGASIMVVNTTIGTSSDVEGKFVLKNIPLKRQQIRISAVGFKAATLTLAEPLEHDLVIRLQPSPILTQAVVITANKRPQSLEEIPVSMSIMTAQAFEQRNTIALDDALRYVPGVNFQQWQINIRASSGYSRGVGSRVSLLIDGVPLLAGDTGEITFEAIPVFQIERVEVLKGAGSTLYGSGALGGVVNVLTKEAEETPSLYWRLYSGMYSKPAFAQWQWTDSRRFFDGQFAGFSSRYDKLGVVFSVNRFSDDGYRESDWSRKYDGFLKLKYDLSPYQSLTLTSNIFSQYRAEFLWWKDFQHALRPADSSGVTVTSLRFNNSLVYKHFVSDVFYYDVKAVHFRGNWYRDRAGTMRLDQSVSDAFVTDVQANWTLHESHILTFGISGNYHRVRANIFGTHDGRGAALYVQDEYRIANALSLITGIRHDIQEVVGTYTEQQTNPKLAVRYTMDEKHTVRLSLGRGFRSPSIGELYTSTSNTGSAAIVVPSVNLKPEHSWTFEVSSTHALSEHVQLDFAVFHNDFYDLIEPNVFSDSLVKINFKNITQAKIEGVETSLRTKMFDHALSFDVHYNYNWAVERNTGAFLRFRPRHIGSVNSTLTISPYTIGADYRFVSRIEQIDEQLVDLAPITNGRQRVDIHLVDVRVITDLTEIGLPIRAALNVNNVLGYNYNELIGNISPPRHFVLSLEGVVR
jgi:outer membrane receptor for ferrienterochelin and colicins